MNLLERFDECISGPFEVAGFDVEYRVDRDGKSARVSFQGTESLEDVIRDFRFWTTPYKDEPWPCRVHKGIYEGYRSAREAIFERLQDAEEVEVQGWSLGAGYALLLFDELFGQVSVRGFGFGTPAIFWGTSKSLRQRFDGFTRICLRGDPFAQGWLPPVLLGYQYVGREVTMGRPAILDGYKHHGDISSYRDELARIC